MNIRSFSNFVTEAQNRPEKTAVAVVEAHDVHTLESVVQAEQDGLIRPILIGNAEKIMGILSALDANPAEFEIVPSAGVEDSLRKAVDMIHGGKANALMKGMLESGDYMKAIVSKSNALVPAGGKLSLIGFYETPGYHKLFAVTDMGVNTYPDLAGKRVIIENAVRLFHAIGIDTPKVAVLSSVEKVNPKMPDTIDGDALKNMNKDGDLTGCIVEGPISFDLATSAEAARIKGYVSPVAGDADLLVVPDITAGNILVKCLTGFAGARTAGTVLGAIVPVILTSRSAEAADKYYSIALAACAAAGI